MGEAHEWYEARSPGLGEEFLAAVELQLKRLEQAPCCMPKSLRVFVAPCCRAFLLKEVRHERASVLETVRAGLSDAVCYYANKRRGLRQ
jgi:hypothetical protein